MIVEMRIAPTDECKGFMWIKIKIKGSEPHIFKNLRGLSIVTPQWPPCHLAPLVPPGTFLLLINTDPLRLGSIPFSG